LDNRLTICAPSELKELKRTKRFWAHNFSNDKFTYITVHKKRGAEGIEDNGVLSADFKGIAVHDCWMPY